MGTVLCGKNYQEEQRICKSCFMISLRFKEIYHQLNMDIINFAELWIAFFQIWAGLWATNLKEHITPSSKTWLH